MEASIQEVARLTGTTSRTLRHYDAIGLLEPSRVGGNGYRWYDEPRARPAAADPAAARARARPAGHPARARRASRTRPAALRTTSTGCAASRTGWSGRSPRSNEPITARENGGTTHGREHVRRVRPHPVQGRGRAALGQGRVRVVRRLVARHERRSERGRGRRRPRELATDWARAAAAGTDPASDEAQALARGTSPGSAASRARPATGERRPSTEYVRRPRRHVRRRRAVRAELRRHRGATFVRDALHVYVERDL